MVHISQIMPAEGERPLFAAGEQVRVIRRFPIGHYRVPRYMRGKRAIVERVIEPAAVDNEEEGFERHAGSRRHYYRLAFPMTELWPGYSGATDSLRIEVFETWFEVRDMTTQAHQHEDCIRVRANTSRGYFEIMEIAFGELLVEKQLIGAGEYEGRSRCWIRERRCWARNGRCDCRRVING